MTVITFKGWRHGFGRFQDRPLELPAITPEKEFQVIEAQAVIDGLAGVWEITYGPEQLVFRCKDLTVGRRQGNFHTAVPYSTGQVVPRMSVFENSDFTDTQDQRVRAVLQDAGQVLINIRTPHIVRWVQQAWRVQQVRKLRAEVNEARTMLYRLEIELAEATYAAGLVNEISRPT